MRSQKRIGRRQVTTAIAGLAISIALQPRYALAAKSGARQLAFRNLHTGDTFASTYWQRGGYDAEALADIDYVLRDHRTDEVASVDVTLLDLLFELRARLGSEERFEVISGYRSPATNAMLARRSGGVAKKSLHMQGRAIDVALPGTALRTLRENAVGLGLGGVGFYPKSGFVHLDVGRPRTW